MTYYIGFDIGGTTVKYGLITESGEIVEKGLFATTPDDGDLIVSNMAAQISKFQEIYEIKSVGISVPGIVRADGYMVTGGAIKPFYDINLKEKCEQVFALPVIVRNDANCAAIAEHWIGNAQGVENYIAIVLGTAVGCGIIINHKIYQGAHGAAGEAGWTMQYPLDYSHNLEQESWNFTSGVVLGLYKRYEKASGKAVSDARVILDLARNGDDIAVQVMNQYYDDVAKGLLNLIATFDPEVLLLGGGISANEEFISNLSARIDKIKKNHKTLNKLTGITVAEVKPCYLRNDAGLIGAVYEAMMEFK
ncbi:transcriptional regulator [Lactococcus hodotermopsidis]|uniref:Transcriptional regulator n=1 Tax=Pseudolactococcus hodotermopsidis TaxID=2709157 RepID=A0A6A0B9A4_9LACT|nr:ROK family protein [Lactococcus hodotermopsidis]GFH42009.1 transcriptional regulator [Lactococcus hodotermopsidis]